MGNAPIFAGIRARISFGGLYFSRMPSVFRVKKASGALTQKMSAAGLALVSCR